MKKRVGIMTLHRALNYGAVWQCWALKRTCEKFGCEVETIDYNPFGHCTYKGLLHHKPYKALSSVLNFWNFNHFVENMLNPTKHTESYDWITQNPPHDDYYIVGSDTVWCESVVGSLLHAYMLDFAPDTAVRISYAASQGGVFAKNPIFAQEIKKFKAVSIREPQFVKETKDLYGHDVEDVCDPSLLISAEEYQRVEVKKWCLPKHYIALFDLAGDPLIKETVVKLQKKHNLPIVNMTGNYISYADRNCVNITPQQWLYIMRNADFICTNSFHGTAFAIIFRRPFVTCSVSVGGRAKTNGRVENLLTQCGLMDRYITNINQINGLEDIDYSNIEAKIEYYKNRSLEWLEKALKS